MQAARIFDMNQTQEYLVYPQGVCRIRKSSSPTTATLYFKGFAVRSQVKRTGALRTRHYKKISIFAHIKKGAGRNFFTPL